MYNALKRSLFDYLLIIVGTTLMALAVVWFFQPNTLVIGGVSGLAIIIANYASRVGLDVPIWLTNIILNAPLFLLAVKLLGKQFFIRTAVSTLYMSAALYYTQFLQLAINHDLVLSSVFGGVLTGIGSAMVFKAAATTGGSDMLAYIIHHRLKHIGLSRILFVIDGAIIVLGFLAFGAEKTMYAIIAAYVTSKLIDSILEGMNFAKAAFIISEKPSEVSARILSELSRGVTALRAVGQYTGNEKAVLLCVVSTKEIFALKEMVYRLDPGAFVIVADVREVLGEGFQAIQA